MVEAILQNPSRFTVTETEQTKETDATEAALRLVLVLEKKRRSNRDDLTSIGGLP